MRFVPLSMDVRVTRTVGTQKTKGEKDDTQLSDHDRVA